MLPCSVLGSVMVPRCVMPKWCWHWGQLWPRPAALQHTVPGVMELRTWADADWLQELAARGEPVLFVGGGLLGLEAADAVLSTGCPVTLVQRGPRLMPRQIDARAGALLTDRLSAKGIEILLGEEIEAINAETAGVSLAFATQPEKERTFAAVVLATGCAPRTELARAADIPCKRGITVNAAMATPLKGVFALGECAEVSGTNYQLVEPIYQQAEVLAKNLCGASAQLPSVAQGSHLKVDDVPLYFAGVVPSEIGADDMVIEDSSQRIYRRLCLQRQSSARRCAVWRHPRCAGNSKSHRYCDITIAGPIPRLWLESGIDN